MIFGLIAAFSFGGGDSVQLAESVGKSLNQTVIVMAAKEEKFQPFGLKYDSRFELTEKMKESAGLVQPVPKWNAFRGRSLPLDNMLPNLARRPDVIGFSEALFVADGLVSSKPNGSIISLQGLQSSSFSKKVKVHWFLQNLPLAVYCRYEPEKEFLSMVASLAAGKIEETATGYSIDLDPVAFRSALTDCFSEANKLNKELLTKQDLAFSVAGVRTFSDSEIVQAFSSRTSFVQIPMPKGSELYKLAMERIKADFPTALGLTGVDINRGGADWLKANVNFADDGMVELRPFSPVRAYLPIKGQVNQWFAY